MVWLVIHKLKQSEAKAGQDETLSALSADLAIQVVPSNGKCGMVPAATEVSFPAFSFFSLQEVSEQYEGQGLGN